MMSMANIYSKSTILLMIFCLIIFLFVCKVSFFELVMQYHMEWLKPPRMQKFATTSIVQIYYSVKFSWR